MILINLIFLLLGSPEHDYHAGIFDIEVKDGRFQISQKLFTDDFEKALELKGHKFEFSPEKENDAFRKAVEAYINEKFSLYDGRERIDLEFVGMEWEELHVVYLYWESVDLYPDIDNFMIRNTIFLEVSGQQQNMHHIQFNEKKMTLLLEKDKTSGNVFGR